MSYTKGPWKVVAFLNGMFGIKTVGASDICEINRVANAHLISASPELFEEHSDWAEKFGAALMDTMTDDYDAIDELARTMILDFSGSGSPTLKSKALSKARGEDNE